MTTTSQPIALVTGASRGLGFALATALLDRGWRVLADARHVDGLTERLPKAVVAPGDVSDPAHRAELAEEVRRAGHLDLLVNNASSLGPSPLPALADYPLAALRAVYETNVLAPLALIQALMPALRASSAPW